MYGFKEAAYWCNVTLTKVFLDNGYKQMSKDKCVFVKSESNHISCCAITVDDCFFATTRDQEWIPSQVDTLKTAFEVLVDSRAWGGDQYAQNDCPYGEGQKESSY